MSAVILAFPSPSPIRVLTRAGDGSAPFTPAWCEQHLPLIEAAMDLLHASTKAFIGGPTGEVALRIGEITEILMDSARRVMLVTSPQGRQGLGRDGRRATLSPETKVL